jgi:hypothetical protein
MASQFDDKIARTIGAIRFLRLNYEAGRRRYKPVSKVLEDASPGGAPWSNWETKLSFPDHEAGDVMPAG